MRLINLLYLHLRIFFHKNIRNYLLFMLESILLIVFISRFTTTLFLEFNYKINYLNKDNYSQYAIMSINNAIEKDMFSDYMLRDYFSDDPNPYQEFVNMLKGYEDFEDVGYINLSSTRINGLSVSHLTFDDCFDEFYQPTVGGNWLEDKENLCIIGGDITELYDIGDTILLDNGTVRAEYTVCDHLQEPYYYLNTNTGGMLNIVVMLETEKNVVFTMSDDNNSTCLSLVVKFDPENISFEELKEKYSQYGRWYTIGDVIDNSKSTRNDIIKANLPKISAVIFICLLISTSGLLIFTQNSKRNHAVMMLVGHSKRQLMCWIILCQGMLFLVSWSIGTVLANIYVTSAVPEAKFFTIGILGTIFMINIISVIAVYSKNTLNTYRNNK